ncbi:MAG: glyoxylase-like metal-dependent hydrolase (beta-lactamase superfamily II) [Natronomonas sp.]|jgi:glyoxylase-like metal-dependent hydrolase (beta-lactamase superfamily II)
MVTELRDGVWWYEASGVNAYFVADEDGVTLVDAGTPFDTLTVEKAVEEAGFSLRDVERVLVTHYDIDHVGSIAKLAIDAPIYIGREDAPFLTGEKRPLPRNIKRFTQFVSGPLVPEVAADRVHPVTDGDDIGGFSAYHTPGHTPGHTAYVHEELAAAFLGDLVIERDGELHPAPWFICDDHTAVDRSIELFAAAAPEFEIAAMGHGTPFKRGGGDRLRGLAGSR